MAVVRIDLEVDNKGNAKIAQTASMLKQLGQEGKAAGAGLGSIFAGVGMGIGQELFNRLASIGPAIGELVARSGQVQQLGDAFNSLATAAGLSASELLGSMRSASQGLITDLDLMQAANKALLLGLPVTTESMGTMATAAVALGKAMGQDAKKSFDDLITALGRGSPLILDNLGITVKVGEANEKYAAQLGKTAEQLTESEKKMAFYNAAMDAAQMKVAEMGGVQLTLADRLTQVQVMWQNGTDAVLRMISASGPLNVLVGGLIDMFVKLSGGVGDSTAALKSWIDGGAILVAHAIGILVRAIQVGIDAWTAFRLAVIAQNLVVEQSITWLKAAADAAKKPAQALSILKKAWDDNTAAGKRAHSAMKEEIAKNVERQNAMEGVRKSVDELTRKVAEADGTTRRASSGLVQHKAVTESAAVSADNLAKALKAQAEAEKAISGIRIHNVKQTEALLEANEKLASLIAGRLNKEYLQGLKDQEEALKNIVKANEERMEAEEAAYQSAVAEVEKYIGHLDRLTAIFAGMGGIGKMLAEITQGLADGADEALRFVDAMRNGDKAGMAISGLTAATNAYNSSARSGAASGAAFGATVGSVIPGVGTLAGAIGGALVGGFLGFIGSNKRAQEEMRRLRAEFEASHGGMNNLILKAAEAGVALNDLFNAKNAEQLQAAMARINGELNLWNEAHQKLNAAMDKYGITLEELGPKFRQQEMDKQAMELFEAFSLLQAAGVDVSVIIQKMGADLLEMAAIARRTGSTLPEEMRPLYEEMLRQGLLVDENGKAFGSLEEAGLNFAKSTSAAMQDLISSIQKLVDALTRIPSEVRTKVIIETEGDVPDIPGGGGGPGGPPSLPSMGSSGPGLEEMAAMAAQRAASSSRPAAPQVFQVVNRQPVIMDGRVIGQVTNQRARTNHVRMPAYGLR